jgi:hypothetical protein
VKAATESAVVGINNRNCPHRSTRREIWGAAIAFVSENVAATAPASQYSPRLCDSMVTMPIGAIATGNRATNAALENPFAPETEKMAL